MGTRAFINVIEKLGGETRETTGRKSVRFGIDVPLLLLIITLIIFGLLMVYSASWDFSYRTKGDPTYIFRRQVLWVGLGSMIALGMTFLKYQYWRKISIPGMIVTILALIAVLLVRDDRFGAMRTIAGGSIQPSELAKIMIIIYLSVWLYNRRDQLRDIWFGLVPLGVIMGTIGGLVILQPDLSAVLTIFLLGGTLFFLAGGDLRQILIILGLGLLIVFLISSSNLFPTGRERIESFWAGLRDLMQSSEHVRRSLEAFVKGGWLGVGIGKSQTKLTGLPFPHTDSIFAVIGEETGVLGASMLVLGYSLLMWRGLRIAGRAPDGLGRLLAAGLTFWIVTEASINMMVMVGLLPFAGNALPFISSGGSSMVVTLAGIGILMNIARQSEQTKEKEERSFNAVVDLRRRDRRRRVSRPVGSASVVSRK